MHRLISISISHYCEKVRWALELAGEPYEESAHLPLVHWAYSLSAGAGRTVPALVTEDGQVLGDSTDILLWIDRRHPQLGLYGSGEAERQEIAALEDLLDEKLGPATRRWGYFHLLPNRALTVGYASQGVPPAEPLILKATFPLVRRLLRRGLGIDAVRTERSVLRMREILAQLSEKLSDGRPFLMGSRLTAADITLASLASPLLQPPEHPLPFPPLEQLPPAMQAEVQAARATPAGQHVLRLYRECRKVDPAVQQAVG